MDIIKRNALYIAFLQAWVATLGSAYFSEIQNLTPCRLCWYQRILMFPLVAILGIAIIRRDKNVAYYVLPLTILGTFIGLYQYLLQMTPLKEINPVSCSETAPCSAIDAIYFGFVTIPFLSMTAFIIISIMMFLLLLKKKK
ncbi:disulfide bond formation protein B [Candidatus Curtissbacteria bacterium]|nr:disulfide bond formation protein B [Candidatus Curtissbacteria bacterium]